MKHMSRPKSAAVKDMDIDIDIADILGQKYRYRIDIGKDDIDPPLMCIEFTSKLSFTFIIVIVVCILSYFFEKLMSHSYSMLRTSSV